MADVFISYSKSHVELTRELAKELEAKGLTVWWDTDLLAGESFRHRIIQEIKACKAAIVIWTRESVHSDYVLSEAERARVAGKLIQLRTADLDPSELPPPFDTSHASLTEGRKAIYGALAKLGVLRNDSTVCPDRCRDSARIVGAPSGHRRWENSSRLPLRPSWSSERWRPPYYSGQTDRRPFVTWRVAQQWLPTSSSTS